MVQESSDAWLRSGQNGEWKRENLFEEDGSKGSKGSTLVAGSEREPETFYDPGLHDVCPWDIRTARVMIDLFSPILPVSPFYIEYVETDNLSFYFLGL